MDRTNFFEKGRVLTHLGFTALILLGLAGCASKKPAPSSASALDPDLGSIWVNAGATSPPTTANTAAGVAVASTPASTLGTVTTLGGPVSSKPENGTYDLGWPRVFLAEGYTNTLYTPQTTSFTGMVLQARAVVAMQSAAMKDPVFGVLDLKALVHVDKAERTAHFTDIQITRADFPSASAQATAYSAIWLPLLKTSFQSVSLDRVVADLAILNAEHKADRVLVENPVPALMFATTPTLLIQVQGPPDYVAVGDTGAKRVLNTRAFVAQAPDNQLYLHVWDGYVTASSLTGAWTLAGKVPREVTRAEEAAVKAKAVDLLAGQPNPQTGKRPSLKTTPLPVIRVVTQPTELVQFDGPANWIVIPGTDLLYVTNTVANVFKCLADQQTYVLVSGRWFCAPGFEGPWAFVPGAKLPQDFAKIPATSPKENVLASVPGTPQARQALVENSIPQMAKVRRAGASMPAPVFDGAPQLRPIEGTTLSYVANSSTPIIEVATNRWYAVQTAVWFTAPSLNGPWTVATTVPAEIYSIPASSPIHYVTYLRVYSFNASYVWVGYTPGYYGTVVASDGVVVYGTGYAYTPWVGSMWIAPPVTYGYYASMAWTPWAGWGYGFSSGWAWAAGWNYWCAAPCAPYWGPYYGWCYGSYYNGYGGVTAWGPGGWAATTGNMYSQWGNWSAEWRGGEGYNAWTGNAGAYQYGHAYNSVTGTMAAGERGAVENVYTGNYAYGGRGVAYNPNSGMAAAGSRYTVGNAYTGNEATAGRGTVYNPATGKSTQVAGVKGASGGVYDVGGHAFATDDGKIYRPSSSGGWDQYGSDGSWKGVQGLDQNRSLSQYSSAQNLGSLQSSSWANHGWQDSSSWQNVDRAWSRGGGNWGGGGWGSGGWGDGGWGDRGGGGGFGGFRGGGFGGFRR